MDQALLYSILRIRVEWLPHTLLHILSSCPSPTPNRVGSFTGAHPSRTMLICTLITFSAMSQLETGLPEMQLHCPMVQLLLKLWVELKHRLGIAGFLDCSPIWCNI